MGEIIEVKGNVLNGGYGAVIHQANSRVQFGAGIALEIKKRFPKAYKADMDFPVDAGRKRLGKFSYALVEHPYNGEMIIVNVYGQDHWGGRGPKNDGVRTEYEYLEKGIRDAIIYIKENYPGVKSFAVPRLIGCGLAGGDWKRVYSDLQKIVDDLDVVLYISEFTP